MGTSAKTPRTCPGSGLTWPCKPVETICKRAILLFLALVLVLSAAPVVAAEGQLFDDVKTMQSIAEDLTSFLRLEISGHVNMRNQVLDAALDHVEQIYPYERFYAFWDAAKVSPGYLCIQWDTKPENVQLWQLSQNGSILSQRDVPGTYDTVEKLLPDTCKVAFVSGREGMRIIRLALYSDGQLPEPFVPWQPTPDHLDYLVVSTHPDDDVLFMGGIVPIYGAERGYVGTVAYVTSPNRLRITEAMMGAWTMGTPYMPLFLGFQDIASVDKHPNLYANRFLPDAVTMALVRLFRTYRPLVVFTQDVNGEYGHWQHKIVSAAVVEAARLAGDASFDPISLAEQGIWQVQKCYVHLYQDDPLILDVNAPLSKMGGRTALEVARASFLKHRSQQTGRHWVQSDTDRYPMSRFGMAYGTVEAGTDAFDNIDPALFSFALANG